MTKRMLIDASHPEETRVVIVDGNQVEELDFESRHKRQIRGNVYLARVTRVEPSLQAAFIEYGGNRHGFLAFPEIHPDYYQIPYEDRMKLIEAEEAEAAEDAADAEDEGEKPKRRKSSKSKSKSKTKSDDESDEDDSEDESESSEEDRDENLDPSDEDVADASDAEVADEQTKTASKRRRRVSRRRYKIQEVVKRGQILLVQAVKEERGNKGAAMTTYLSLAGRYCVLMPNTARGGGISRKIANGSDRKRLKSIMSDISVPQGMGVIVRTAGAKRNKSEIKRDFDYLSRLWSDIRETTLKSSAPALIHEEGDLVKRSIRDLYNKDIAEVLVEGKEAYKSAKTFIKMLMPSHAKFVKEYKEDIPLFLRFSVERQIENSLDSVVQLKSGGYLVIHPTEALVSIDVNSGRSTKERNVERTALRTNLEAAEEVARQMRLRDLAGLIVIDFIDMDENRNNRSVEKKMKDSLARDRARIQTSRISQFGLMEISRQRRRRSLLEGSTASCPHCSGVGRKRTVESSALAAIRAVEEIGARQSAKRIRLKTSPDVALYLFNEKRNLLQHVEERCDVFTEIIGDEELIRPAYDIEIIEKRSSKGPDPLDAIEKELRKEQQEARKSKKSNPDESKEDRNSDDSDGDRSEKSEKDDDDNKGSRRRNRRGRRGGRNRRNKSEEFNQDETSKSDEDKTEDDKPSAKSDEDSGTSGNKPSRSRGRRRAPSRNKTPETSEAKAAPDSEDKASDEEALSKPSTTKPAAKGRRRKAPSRKPKGDESKPDVKSSETADTPKDTQAETAKPKRKVDESRRRKAPPRRETTAKATKKPAARKSAKASKPKVRESKTELKSTVSRRRAAPKRAEAESKPEPKKAAAKKAPAKKTAPKKAASKKPAAKKAPAKTAATKKAPARNAAAPKATASAEPKAEKPKARRKAPAKKAAPAKAKPAPKAATKPTPKTKVAPKPKAAPAEKPVASKPVVKAPEPVKPEPPKVETPDPASVKPKRKKKSWLDRLIKPD